MSVLSWNEKLLTISGRGSLRTLWPHRKDTNSSLLIIPEEQQSKIRCITSNEFSGEFAIHRCSSEFTFCPISLLGTDSILFFSIFEKFPKYLHRSQNGYLHRVQLQLNCVLIPQQAWNVKEHMLTTGMGRSP